jgi:hypothetical protein
MVGGIELYIVNAWFDSVIKKPKQKYGAGFRLVIRGKQPLVDTLLSAE